MSKTVRMTMLIAALVLMAALFTLLWFHEERQPMARGSDLVGQVPALSPAGERSPAPAALTPLLKKGRVTYVNFWASWCAPCLKELPALSELQFAFGTEHLRIVLLNVDSSESGRAEARGMHGRLAPNLELVFSDAIGMDPKILDSLAIPALPFHMLIDGSGRLATQFAVDMEQQKEAVVERLTSLIEE
jgi:thiol-disulfide isomerase/thioredoxin